MNNLAKKISLVLVLSASTIAAFANPAQAKSERDVVRAVRQHQDAAERNDAQAGRNFQSPENDRSSEEGFKRQSRLSPEERRALRRQINEAGQDLYIRKQ
jgi:Ni/Co efflux regulator RcnB